MCFKRIIYALLYNNGEFHLSRNFRLQKVGDINWLKNNFGFGETCDFIDELMILNVTRNSDEKDKKKFLNDVNKLREKIFVPITLGGGIRSLNHAKLYFENGADKVMINYLSHSDKQICQSIANIFGDQALSVMVDYKIIENHIVTFINGGKEKSYDFKEYIEQLKSFQFGELILNSINNDGTGYGFDEDIVKLIPNTLKNPILLMGGAGKPEHFYEILKHKKVAGAVTANLFNFLGNGLELSRNFSIEKGIKIIQFSNINEKNI